MPTFKIDENLPVEAVQLFTDAECDAAHALDQELGGATDQEVIDKCKDEGRVLVTLDLDFSDIRTFPPADYAGIVVLRPARQDKSHVLSVVGRLLPTAATGDIAGALWIVDETTIRVRR